MHDISIPVPDGSMNVWHRQAAPASPTIVLIHGLSGNSRWWSRVIERLPVELGLLCLDVRGRGASFDSPPPYDLATIADDVARCLDHFQLDSAVVAGYSMGGWIAALFARRYPQRVTRLLLVDGGLSLPVDPNGDAEEIIEAVVGPSLARLDVEFGDRDSFIAYWKSHPALEKHWEDAMEPALDFELFESDNGYVVRINPAAIQTSARQITVDPLTRDAGRRVEVPTHLIVVERGTADQEGGMIPLSTAEEAATAMPNLTMEYLPGVNHYTLLMGAGAPAVASAIAR